MRNHEIEASANHEARVVRTQSESTERVPPNPIVEDFLATMPERYQQEFGRVSVRQHAHIAMSRSRQAIYVDCFTGSSTHGPGICVVATDGPGLLAVISTALLLEGFDITRADAYTRRAGSGGFEAVDLFWVRRAGTAQIVLPKDEELDHLRFTLLELLNDGSIRQHLQDQAVGISPGASETSVQFRYVRGSRAMTLELQSNDRPGLLAVVTAALASEGVQIIESRIRTHGLRVHDYFEILEADGSKPHGTRLQRIQLAVLTAVDGPHHGA